MVERKIYSPWAFTENEGEKRSMNRLIYSEELKPKAKQFWSKEPTQEELQEFTCCKHITNGYRTAKYEILSNPHNFSTLQLALICDKGNLCFGYRTEGKSIIVYTD